MSAFDEYRSQRTMLLTTHKRDGATVDTPVSAGPEAAEAARMLAAKYPVLQGLLVPAIHRLTKKTTVHYELLPPDVA